MTACYSRLSARVIAQRIEEPVTVMASVVPQPTSVLALAHHIVHPAFHAVVLLFQNMDTAECHVVVPRNNGGCIRPTGSSCAVITIPIDVRNDSGHSSVGALVHFQVGQPFIKEVVHLTQEGSGTEEHLGISRPSQSLIALRTIGRHIHKIIPEAPLNVMLKLVDDRI